MIKHLLVISFMMLIAITSEADDLSKHLKVTNFYLEVEKPFGSNRSAYMPMGEETTNYLNLGFDLSVLNRGYLSTKILSQTNSSQFRHVGLEAETGVDVYSGIQLYVRHFSGHVLDSTTPFRFPEENSIGIRLNFIKR